MFGNMSRIGKQPILVPSGVSVEKQNKKIVVIGPKGQLALNVQDGVVIEIEGQNIIVKRKNEQKKVKALHGLTRNLVNNMILGVTDGWSKDLELVGVGFRAQVNGNKLVLNVGYSHSVEIEAPEGITFEVADNTKIKVSGIDKQLVGQVAANLKKVRMPDVYKGKGIRYQGEYIKKKVGKSAKVVGTAGTGGK